MIREGREDEVLKLIEEAKARRAAALGVAG
jgi:hypothetical protein